MSKQLKKSLIYSLILAIILTIASSFISFRQGCCDGCLCEISRKNYGYPLPFMSEALKITQPEFLIFDFMVYFVILFIIVFIIFLVIDFIKNKKLIIIISAIIIVLLIITSIFFVYFNYYKGLKTASVLIERGSFNPWSGSTSIVLCNNGTLGKKIRNGNYMAFDNVFQQDINNIKNVLGSAPFYYKETTGQSNAPDSTNIKSFLYFANYNFDIIDGSEKKYLNLYFHYAKDPTFKEISNSEYLNKIKLITNILEKMDKGVDIKDSDNQAKSLEELCK